MILVQAPTEPVQVFIESGGPSITDWLGLALTAVLIAVTVVYVVYTQKMATRMEAQLSAAEEARLREKSDRGAYRCLDAVEELRAEYEGRPPAAVDRGAFEVAHVKLRAATPLLHDQTVRSYVDSLRHVLFVASFSQEQVAREDLDAGLVRVIVQDMARRVTTVLHADLAERPIPPNAWIRNGEDGLGDRFPDPSEAASWIREAARRARH